MILSGKAAANKIKGDREALRGLARAAQVTQKRLLETIEEDETLLIDDDTHLLCADPVIGELPRIEEGFYSEEFDPSLDVFKLSSRPNSNKKVVLDFTGATVENTWWNPWNNGEPIVCAPFSVDGDPTTLNDVEKHHIFRIWQHVAEDFAPFDVDITTKPHTQEELSWKTDDEAYGLRTIITSTNWYQQSQGSSIGGIAFIGTFKSIPAPPCFVFSTTLMNSPKYVAECASHEIGHTLSMLHHGKLDHTYYTGHGAWAPIMGAGYYVPVTQWAMAEYQNATKPEQDDIARATNHLGLAEEFLNRDVAVQSGSKITGRIVSASDKDAYHINAKEGVLLVSVTPTGQPSNLHPHVKILDKNGNVIHTAEPTHASGVIDVDVNLSSGSYSIEVSGGSWLTPDTGFSDYASLGGYTIQVEFEEDEEQQQEDPQVDPKKVAEMYEPIKPVRVLDTRPNRPKPEEVLVVDTGHTDAVAAHINITAVDTRGWAFFTAWADGARPETSVLNADRVGQTIANAVTVPLAGDGTFLLYTSGGDHVIVDVMGLYK